MTERVQPALLYIDANPFIYAVEGGDVLASPINALFGLLRERPGCAVTSELTLAEVLPKAPLPRHRRSYFDLMVWSGIFDLRPVTREILVETADYRKIAATKRPDGSEVMPGCRTPFMLLLPSGAAARASCPQMLEYGCPWT